MSDRLFKGAYAIVLTPFKDNGDVDYNLLEKHVEKSLQFNKLAGFVVCGSTGEYTRLSFEENIQLMKTVKDVNAGRTQFICGATAGDSYTAAKYVECINKIGADGILLAPPYYFTLTDDEIYAYYKETVKDNSIPLVGYNIPQCTNPVSVSVFERLLEFKSLKGFKNSWNDMQEITSEIALRDSKRADVSMLTGLDACLYGTLALGGDGVFSAISYLLPDIMDFIYENYGKIPEAFKCQCELIKLINIVNRFTFPYGYRVLSDAVGMDLGRGREAVPQSVADKTVTAIGEMADVINNIRRTYLS